MLMAPSLVFVCRLRARELDSKEPPDAAVHSLELEMVLHIRILCSWNTEEVLVRRSPQCPNAKLATFAVRQQVLNRDHDPPKKENNTRSQES